MSKFTKFLSLMMVLALSSVLVFGQALTIEQQKAQQLKKEALMSDFIPGVHAMGDVQLTDFDYTKLASSDGTKAVLYDNGPLITNPGGGAGGADLSALQTGLGMNTLGGGFQISAGNSIADDFEVTATWTVSTITFYSYQTGAGSGTSTHNDVRFQVYDGDPTAGGSVIWGDLTTNRLISSAWTNIYRATDSAPTASDRAIMDVIGDATGLVLTPGTYWIEVQVGGSASYSGPWCPPVTILGQTTTGNAKQNVTGTWGNWLDTGTSTGQGMPFMIEGNAGGLPDNDLSVNQIIEPTSGFNLTNAEPVTIKIQNLGNNAQSNFNVSFSVDGGAAVVENVSATVPSLGSYEYTFTATADLSTYGSHTIEACTMLGGDANPDNDCKDATVSNMQVAAVYPQSADYWTGSTDGSAKTETSIVNCIGDVELGWMKFDITSIPPDAVINSVKFHGYVSDTYYPYWSITPLSLDPVTASAADLWSAIFGATAQGVAYAYNNEASTYAPGWHEYTLGTTIIEDFTAALAQGWFAVGCADRDAGTTYYLIMDGWNETNVPWLEIDYSSGTVLDPPTNLTASVDECDVHLEWDAPGGGGEGQWIYWDQQVNGADGIGLTAGGTFYCASHWNPSDLAPYDGMYMTKMNWYHYDNAATATFILKVWTGANAGTEIMSQTVSSAIGWNEVDLTSPVMIDASQELWFGYEVTHPTGENPAGVDFGPAIYGYGDMISLDGTSWVSMGTEYGLDYNWNLGAYVMDMTDGQGPAQPLVKSTIENPANASFDVASGAPGQYNKFTPNANKALNGYNVYRSGNLLDFTTETMYDDMNVPDGTYNYCVTAVYDEGQSAPVCEEVTVECGNVLDPPTNLTYETDECLVMLDWNAPGGGPTGAILVVDRDGSFDGGYSDDWATIQAALDANGYTYDYYEVTDLTQNGPDLATMVQYDLIIWFSGEAWGYYGDDCMTGTDENNVASFLDGGGALLFSGMDYFYASYPSAGNFTAGQFPYDYLGVTSAVQDNWNVFNPDVASVTGYGAAAGLTFSLQDIYSAKDGLYIDKITHMGDDIFQITSPTPAGMCAVQYDGGSFKSIYTTASLAAITNAGDAAEVIGACVDWLMSTDGKALTGYNVYRDGNLLGFTTATEYTDNSITSSGTYEYCVTAVYDEGESQPICADIAVTCGGTPDCDVFFDDFESYTVGQQLVAQNSTDWTTWSNSPGSTEDPYIVDNGGNVVEITGVNDLVYVMDNYTSGFYTMMFDMYVPTGGDGYFNTLQDFAGTASSWGMQVYFGINNPGEGNLDAGGAMAQMFSFDYDTWMQIKVTVDLDDDWGEFFLNGTLIHGWVWSTGAFGTNSLNQLGGNNFYANPGVNANPLFHFDNYCVDSEGGGNLPPAPENLTGSIVGSDVLLEWEWPAGEGQWIYWDQQVNGADGIGLTAGGTFLCASHWYPADLAPYDGMYINKMNWYHYDNAATATFVLKVWTGANAGTQVMSQSVSSSIGWNEVDLTNPVMIDASTELWFGYEVTHPTGENPAGVDFGPAIYGYGDMISLDGTSWVSMGTEYGLDYNWNLGAYVGGVVEGKTIAQPMVKDIIPAPSNGSFVTSPTNTGVYNKFMPNESKAFDGFNVWHSFNSGSFEPLATGVMDYSYTHVEPEHGLHTYYVTAVVDGLESLPSNEWEVVITGIEDNIFNATQVYPNPATDLVNIRSEYNIEAVTVYNFAGQAISEETVDSKFYQINTSSYNSGVYLFQIRTDEGVISKRIIIE